VHAGDIPERNLVRSEVEVARADADVARAELDAATRTVAIQTLMGVAHPDTALRALGTLDYRPVDLSQDTLMAFALGHRPDLLAAGQRVAQSQAGQRSATSLLFPTPVFSFVRQYTGPFESGHFYSLGLAFELPSLNLYGGQRHRAAAGLAASRFTRQRAETRVEQDVTTAVAAFRIQQGLVARYQSGLLAKMDDAVAGARYAYSRGATSLLEVLDAVRSQQDVRAEYYSALHDYWVAAFAVHAATGADVTALIPR
jgi:outer membrane protein, heavy metal efflux system